MLERRGDAVGLDGAKHERLEEEGGGWSGGCASRFFFLFLISSICDGMQTHSAKANCEKQKVQKDSCTKLPIPFLNTFVIN